MDTYISVYQPSHPRARKNGLVFKHILVAEKALGHALPLRAQIHHTGAKSDNSNLVICEDQSYHGLLEQRTRALLACGDANARKCEICKSYNNQEDILIRPHKGRGDRAYHSDCCRSKSLRGLPRKYPKRSE